VAALPADFPAAICLVMHTAPEAPGVLPDIVARVSRLPTAHPRDGERLKTGHIYVAPPDYHLRLEPGRLRITVGRGTRGDAHARADPAQADTRAAGADTRTG